MASVTRLVILGTITFFAGLILLFPAQVANHFFAPQELQLTGVSGTIWRGRALAGDVAGLPLADVNWRFRPAALLGGGLGYAVSLSPADGFLEADIRVGAGGTVTLTDVDGRVSISALQDLVPAPGIEGTVRVDFERLRFDDSLPTVADGVIEIASLVVRGLSQSPLGDYRAELTSGDGAVTGSLQDLDAVLDIAGSVRIGADRSYLLTGLVAETPETPASVTSQLRFLGSPNERGQRQFRFEGRL